MFCKSLVRSGLLAYKQDFHSGLKCVTAACVNVGVMRQESSSTVLGRDKLKTMEDLGGPSFLTSLYWLFGKGYLTITHQMQIEHKKIYGPLWKSKYGDLVFVNVAQADLIEQVLRQEGRYPIRINMPHWRGYRELRNQAYGPLTGLGEEWQHMRSILNPRMLKPKHVSSYVNPMNDVVRDFIEKLAWLKATKGNGVMVHNLSGELYKFAFEGKTFSKEYLHYCQNIKCPNRWVAHYNHNTRGVKFAGMVWRHCKSLVFNKVLLKPMMKYFCPDGSGLISG